METFSALLALCAWNLPVTGEWPSEVPVTRNFNFSLICTWMNVWVNNHEAGDLGRHRAHYDVIVMMQAKTLIAYGFIQFSMFPHAFYTTHKNRHGY